MILAKLCILGEVSVGKTSLIRRYVDRAFSDVYLSTVGVKISRRLLHIPIPDGGGEADIQLVIWDLEGGSGFGDVSAAYLKGALGAVVVGDITRAETMKMLDAHIKRFRTVNPRATVAVALNKSDLQHDGLDAPMEHVHLNEAVDVVLRTSAKSGDGVDDLFAFLGTRFLQRAENGSPV
jgi:small GTP-binding protein